MPSLLENLGNAIMADVLYPFDRPVVQTLVKAVAHTAPDIAEVILRTMSLLQETHQLTSFCLDTEDLLEWFDTITPCDSVSEPQILQPTPVKATVRAPTSNTINPAWLNFNVDNGNVTSGLSNSAPELSEYMFIPANNDYDPLASINGSSVFSTPMTSQSDPWTDSSLSNSDHVLKSTLSSYIHSPASTTTPDLGSPCVSSLQQPLSHFLSPPTSDYSDLSAFVPSDPLQDIGFLCPDGYLWPSLAELDTRTAAYKSHLSALSMSLGTSVNLLSRTEAFIDLLAMKIARTTGRKVPMPKQPIDLTRDEEDVAVSSLFIDEGRVEAMLEPLQGKIVAVVQVMGEAMQATANKKAEQEAAAGMAARANPGRGAGSGSAIGATGMMPAGASAAGPGTRFHVPNVKPAPKPRKRAAPKEGKTSKRGAPAGQASKKARVC